MKPMPASSMTMFAVTTSDASTGTIGSNAQVTTAASTVARAPPATCW